MYLLLLVFFVYAPPQVKKAPATASYSAVTSAPIHHKPLTNYRISSLFHNKQVHYSPII